MVLGGWVGDASEGYGAPRSVRGVAVAVAVASQCPLCGAAGP